MTYASEHVTVAPAISYSAVWTLRARVSLTSAHARLTLPDCDADSGENCKEDEDDYCNGDIPLHDAVLVYGCSLYAEEVNVIWCMYEVSWYGSFRRLTAECVLRATRSILYGKGRRQRQSISTGVSIGTGKSKEGSNVTAINSCTARHSVEMVEARD